VLKGKKESKLMADGVQWSDLTSFQKERIGGAYGQKKFDSLTRTTRAALIKSVSKKTGSSAVLGRAKSLLRQYTVGRSEGAKGK
jgi:hypothetical protein